MELYLNNRIKKKLKDIQTIRKNYGDLSDTIVIRINKLKVANNLNEISIIKPERLHQLQGEYEGMYRNRY